MKWYWLIWFVVGFGVPEGIELATRHYGGTLSDTVWNLCKVTTDQPPWRWSFLHYVLLAFMIWLLCHFVLRIWR